MKFYIERTSDHHNGSQPTPNAVCTCRKYYKQYDMYQDAYTIEINTLEELMKLVEKEGRIIILPTKRMPTIEIYDDFRE